MADHDVKTEITPTERSAYFRFTFPESEDSYVVVDAFDNGSFIRIDKENNTITGYTTKNSGGVPDNFKNYFVRNLIDLSSRQKCGVETKL